MERALKGKLSIHCYKKKLNTLRRKSNKKRLQHTSVENIDNRNSFQQVTRKCIYIYMFMHNIMLPQLKATLSARKQISLSSRTVPHILIYIQHLYNSSSTSIPISRARNSSLTQHLCTREITCHRLDVSGGASGNRQKITD